MLCCPFPPIDHPGLLQNHLFHVLWADHSHVHRHLLFKVQCVPLRPLAAQGTVLTHDCARKSSHLSPCLHLQDLLPQGLQLLISPSSQPGTFRQASVGMVESSSSTSKLFTSKYTESATPIPSCLLLLPPASSIGASLQAQFQVFGLTTLSQGPSPFLATFSSKSSCHFSERPNFS